MSDSVRPHRRQPTRLPRPWDSPGKNTGVGCHFLLQYMKVKSEIEVAQSCPTPSDSMDCSLPGSSIHGILQARILEQIAVPFSRGSSQPREWTWVSHTAGRFFTIWATREAHYFLGYLITHWMYLNHCWVSLCLGSHTFKFACKFPINWFRTTFKEGPAEVRVELLFEF